MFSALNTAQKIGVGFVVVMFFVSLVMMVNHLVDKSMTIAKDSGATEVRAQGAEEGLQHVEDANKAADGVARDAGKRQSGCVRYSRTPENC